MQEASFTCVKGYAKVILSVDEKMCGVKNVLLSCVSVERALKGGATASRLTPHYAKVKYSSRTIRLPNALYTAPIR